MFGFYHFMQSGMFVKRLDVDKDCQVVENPCQEILTMATMNVSLPDAMKSWVESLARSGRYSNSSDYVRDLIRKDQERADIVANMQALVTEGINSGEGKHSVAELREIARKRLAGTQ